MVVKEADIQSQIIEFLKAAGVLHWRMPVDGVRTGQGRRRSPIKGFPDIAGVHKGTFFGIEVKRLKGRFYPEQLVWAEKLQSHGAWYLTATSLNDVVEFIQKLKSGTAWRQQ